MSIYESLQIPIYTPYILCLRVCHTMAIPSTLFYLCLSEYFVYYQVCRYYILKIICGNVFLRLQNPF
jgi:hypothetical protein